MLLQRIESYGRHTGRNADGSTRVTTDHARTAVIRVISSLKIPYFLMERPVPLIIELVCARPEHPPKAVKVMASK